MDDSTSKSTAQIVHTKCPQNRSSSNTSTNAYSAPPKATLLKAIKNNQLATWPGLTYEAVEKYLPDSCPATDKGHIKRQRKGIRSTKKTVLNEIKRIETTRGMNPLVEREAMNQIFMTMGYLD